MDEEDRIDEAQRMTHLATPLYDILSRLAGADGTAEFDGASFCDVFSVSPDELNLAVNALKSPRVKLISVLSVDKEAQRYRIRLHWIAPQQPSTDHVHGPNCRH